MLSSNFPSYEENCPGCGGTNGCPDVCNEIRTFLTLQLQTF